MSDLFAHELDEDLLEIHKSDPDSEPKLFRIQVLRKLDALLWAVEALDR